jgi:hypothetical protein
VQSLVTSHTITPDAHLPDWIDIMVHPRSAFERILDTRSLRSALILATIFSLLLAAVPDIDTFILSSTLSQEPVAVGLVDLTRVIVTALAVMVAQFVLPALVYKVVGQLLGGDGDVRDMMMAIGWASVPGTLSAGLIVVDTLIAAGRMKAGIFSEGPLDWIVTGAIYAMVLYMVVLYAITFSIAHRFTVVQALSTLIIPALLVQDVIIAVTYFLP